MAAQDAKIVIFAFVFSLKFFTFGHVEKKHFCLIICYIPITAYTQKTNNLDPPSYTGLNFSFCKSWSVTENSLHGYEKTPFKIRFHTDVNVKLKLPKVWPTCDYVRERRQATKQKYQESMHTHLLSCSGQLWCFCRSYTVVCCVITPMMLVLSFMVVCWVTTCRWTSPNRNTLRLSQIKHMIIYTAKTVWKCSLSRRPTCFFYLRPKGVGGWVV